MKKKFPSILLILTVAMVAACGPAPTPTLSAEEVSNTAIAQAWIAITQTQAAMPTATASTTPLPPTQTPLPTITFLPTLAPLSTSSASNPGAATQDPCNQPPPVKPLGSLAQVKFVNKSGGRVNLSFGMNSANAQAECVTYTYVLSAFAEQVESVLAGCYWAFGWIDGKQPSTAQTIDLLCFDDPNSARAVWITTEVIAFH